METKLSIQKSLASIQRKLEVPKDLNNTFGGYKYRSAEQIEAKLKPLLKEENALLILDDEILNLGERYYIKSKARFIIGDEEISACGLAREQQIKKGMTEDQITGSASSYARKYALGALFLIDDTKDSDSQDNSNEGKTEPVKESDKNFPASPKQKKFINDLLEKLKIEKDDRVAYLEEHYGIIPKQQMTSLDAKTIIEDLLEVTSK